MGFREWGCGEAPPLPIWAIPVFQGMAQIRCEFIESGFRDGQISLPKTQIWCLCPRVPQADSGDGALEVILRVSSVDSE